MHMAHMRMIMHSHTNCIVQGAATGSVAKGSAGYALLLVEARLASIMTDGVRALHLVQNQMVLTRCCVHKGHMLTAHARRDRQIAVCREPDNECCVHWCCTCSGTYTLLTVSNWIGPRDTYCCLSGNVLKEYAIVQQLSP